MESNGVDVGVGFIVGTGVGILVDFWGVLVVVGEGAFVYWDWGEGVKVEVIFDWSFAVARNAVAV